MTEVIKPLPGEEGAIPSVAATKPASNIGRNLAIVGGMVGALGAVGFAVVHFLHGKDAEVADAKPSATTTAATAQAAPLNMPSAASAAAFGTVGGAASPAPATPAQAGVSVPSIAAQPGDAKAIPLANSNPNGGGYQAGYQSATAPRKPLDPDDAPIFAGGSPAPGDSGASTVNISSANPSGAGYTPAGQAGNPNAATPDRAAAAKANLNALKGQLGGLMETLQHRLSGQNAAVALPTSSVQTQEDAPSKKAPLFGNMEQSYTPTVSAHMLSNMSMLVPKGTLFLCSLKTRVITANAGLVACQTERNVLSADGKVTMLERGSHLDGEYRVVQIKPGVTSVPVIWTRIRTPQGVDVDLDSAATDQLGASGLDGYVDNRWGERIGASVLLSLIQDAVQYATTPTNATASTNVVLPNTTGQGSKLAEKVLDATINIPPLLYQNQGGVVGVYVARDLTFSSVYELRAK